MLGCTTRVPAKKMAGNASANYKESILNAQKISKANPQKAILQLDQLLSSNPENNLSDDALFLLATLLEKTKQDEAALRAYSRILDSKYASPLDGKALLQKANLLISKSQSKKALETLNYIKKYKLQDQSSLVQIEKIRSQLLFKEGDYIDYLQSAQNLIQANTDLPLKRKTFKQAHDIIKIRLNPDDYKKILLKNSLSLFHPIAALSLSEYYIEDSEPERAVSILEKFNAILEQRPYKNKRDELLTRTQAYTTPNFDTIGIILPLSGKYQSIGQEVLKGLQFSLGAWSPNGFKLSVLDSEADADQTAHAVDQVIAKDRPVALIGGLVSKSAEALLEKAEEFRIPTLVLSQKEGLTKKSKYGFQNAQSMTAYNQLMAEMALELGFQKVGLMHSKHNFSKKYADSFISAFKEKGGEISSVIEYDMDERRGLPNAVKKLVHLDTSEGREEEYNAAVEKWKKSTKSRGATSLPGLEDLLPPQLDLDALFIADGAKNGGLVASTLAYYDVESLPLLGTHLWNDTDLLERGQRFIENALFASPYYEPSVLSSDCAHKYSNFFQETLTPYIHKGIEAGIIIRNTIVNNDVDSRSSLLSSLQSVQTITDFCLPKGLIHKDHNFYSPLIPLTVQNKSIVVYDPKTYVKPSDKSPKF